MYIEGFLKVIRAIPNGAFCRADCDIICGILGNIKDNNIDFRVNGSRLEGEDNISGGFRYNPYASPPQWKIELWRDEGENDFSKLHDELFTLAHEYGHYISYTNGTRTLVYLDALYHHESVWPELSQKRKQAILTEERRAWKYAKHLVIDIAPSYSQEYDRRTEDAMAEYRKMLGLVLR